MTDQLERKSESCRSFQNGDISTNTCCANLDGAANPVRSWGLIASNGFTKAPYPTPAISYFDPIQGHADDCHFIAALSSVAWTKPSMIKRPVAPLDTFNFYKTPSVPTNPATTISPVKISENLPKDASGALIYATCSAASPAGESWPMVYEKAYASWLLGGGDTPNIGGFRGGNVLTAIQNIVGLTVHQFTTTTSINGMLTNATLVDSGTGKALWPMAAGTSGGNPVAKIYANHCYSILGCHFSSPGVPDYIVMREPYGGRFPEPTLAADVITSGTWNGINLATTTDGVFALRASKFSGYFQYYGYVK